MKNKKSNNKNFYFTKETEQAIVDYAKSTCKKEKNELYVNHISKVLKELIDNIVQVYNLGRLPNIELLKEECLLYLISVFAKFNEKKGSAAFTYFTVVAKNWFFFQFKKHKKQKFEEIDIDEILASTKLSSQDIDSISVDNDYECFRESAEFYSELIRYLTQYKNEVDNDKLLKVIDSIVYIFENVDQLDFLNKKGIYVYLREISGLETKEISNCIKKILPIISEYKNKWNNGEI
jgi:hypothetical protein